MLILRDNYDKLTADKVAKSLMRVNQAYYVQEGKGWKIVRFDVKDNPIQAELTVSSITTVSGSLGWILDR